uniref:Uncharacterized protein n=1 Tax=Timema bartmani TaxID=61472 RepID=A0A7R9I863_9NEOP|nr:unnamed protein product [Timema bartmani]
MSNLLSQSLYGHIQMWHLQYLTLKMVKMLKMLTKL